jgi:hypothetical protein
VPLGLTEAVVGETAIEVPLVVTAATVITAVAVFAVLATLVAVTVSLPVALGAVYTPDELIVPRVAFHVTDLFVVVPVTLAVNCCVLPVTTDVEVGDTLTELTLAGVVIVTFEVATLDVSAWLKTVMVAVPGVEGAV